MIPLTIGFRFTYGEDAVSFSLFLHPGGINIDSCLVSDFPQWNSMKTGMTKQRERATARISM